jgi:hypothetical protein
MRITRITFIASCLLRDTKTRLSLLAHAFAMAAAFIQPFRALARSSEDRDARNLGLPIAEPIQRYFLELSSPKSILVFWTANSERVTFANISQQRHPRHYVSVHDMPGDQASAREWL